MLKETVFSVKLEADLRDAFMAEADDAHRPASRLVREFMREIRPAPVRGVSITVPGKGEGCLG
jgi:hypothetical protein